MAKATNKAELMKAADENFNKMWEMINSFSQKEQEQNFTYNKNEQAAKDNAAHWQRDNNIRDVLTHLYEWHMLLLNWVESNVKGDKKAFLPDGITWTNYQKMNVGFFEKHQTTSYENAKKMLDESHKKVVALIEKFSNEELFEKKHFSWVGTTSLAQYCHSATIAHYDFAMKKLKAYQKALKG